jgi:hypothetical protein
MHKDVIITDRVLPNFKNAREKLLVVRDWKDCPRYVYVSHKWLNIEHPDDALATILSVLSLVVKTMRVIEYIWFDYSCSPVDEIEKLHFIHQLNTIISNSIRVLVVPFKSIGEEAAPVYDMEEFTSRAWCMYEACSFLKKPSKIRIAKITKANQSFQLSMVNLPSRNYSDGVNMLTDNFQKIREMVKQRAKQKFIDAYHSYDEKDKDLLWQSLLDLETSLFSAQRAESDFFVGREGDTAVESTSMKTVRESNIYEPDVLKKLQPIPEKNSKQCVECNIS